jgi:hypothetical protein
LKIINKRKGEIIMMTKKERMEKLNNAGINTGKYFTLNVSENIPAGAKIHIVVDKDGNYIPEVVKENDVIFNQIIEDGYVRNTKLHRRWVMAQMFHMLNYVSYDGKEKGYNACLRNHFDYKYTLDMMIEEVRVLSKLETRDKESFVERSKFFTKEVVVDVLNDYLEKLKQYVETLPDKNCKGVPYKTVKGVNIFNADLDKKLYRPIRDRIQRVQRTVNYGQMYTALQMFMRYSFVKLPYNTPKSKVWVDAYKGEGAYYTLKNLVMFHDCTIFTGRYGRFDTTARRFDGIEAVNHLKAKLDEYKGEGWRMFALMKKVIEDNNFDFNKRMKELDK